ncbi:unnamed protein product [Adineta ricciae]|uniref:PAS domain-containing protein n=1 Tax=Adineta ricciae TaxID=249248 RepID=A0A815D335_ADIRI|nr:unnamed protein product [Adineta ricciae]
MYEGNIQQATNPTAGLLGSFANLYYPEETETTQTKNKHSQKINKLVEELYKLTFISRRGQFETVRSGGRKNKNEILALVLARLNKKKYLNGSKYFHESNLARDIQVHSNTGEFILVLRTDGRVIAMSDEAEHHLEKSMRSLYTQCVNIFESLDRADGERLRSILTSSAESNQQEHRLVCTLRLPKGKRPSRINEDVKTISIAGHFYTCKDSSSSTSNERLFIARCEALISATVNRSSSSQTSTMNTSNSLMKIMLNEDMTVQNVSSNVHGILGYSNKDMFGNWIGRYLPTCDMDKFEAIRKKHFEHEPDQQQSPISVCDVFDMYTNNGEGRLTFLCQIRPIRERRKPVKFAIVAQLVNPSQRGEYLKYVQSAGEANINSPKAEQVNFGAPFSSVSQTSQDTILANSPTFTNVAELIFDGTAQYDTLHRQQYSPFNDILSNAVAPINVDDESGNELFYTAYGEFSSTDSQYWPGKYIDSICNDDSSADDLENAIYLLCNSV